MSASTCSCCSTPQPLAPSHRTPISTRLATGKLPLKQSGTRCICCDWMAGACRPASSSDDDVHMCWLP